MRHAAGQKVPDLTSHRCSERCGRMPVQAGQDDSTQLPNGRDLTDPAAAGPSDPAEPVPQRQQPPPVQSIEAARTRSAALPPGRTGLPHTESFNTDVVQENLARHRTRRQQQQQQEGGRALSHTGGACVRLDAAVRLPTLSGHHGMATACCAFSVVGAANPLSMPSLTGSSPCPAGSHLQLHWLSRPRTVLVVAKPSPEVLVSLVNVVFWLLQRDTTVYVEPSIFHRMTEVTACHLLLQCSGLRLVGRVRLRRAQRLASSAALLCLP